jgi:hypothetical protein
VIPSHDQGFGIPTAPDVVVQSLHCILTLRHISTEIWTEGPAPQRMGTRLTYPREREIVQGRSNSATRRFNLVQPLSSPHSTEYAAISKFIYVLLFLYLLTTHSLLVPLSLQMRDRGQIILQQPRSASPLPDGGFFSVCYFFLLDFLCTKTVSLLVSLSSRFIVIY